MMPQAHPGKKPENNSCCVRISSDPAEARRIQQDIEQALKALDYSEPDIFGIRLAIEEALVNAIKHGNQMDRSKKVHIDYHVRAEEFEIAIADEGAGFSECDVPDPTDPENIERCCGRGLMLMKHYMSEVSFSRAGTAVRMRKLRKK